MIGRSQLAPGKIVLKRFNVPYKPILASQFLPQTSAILIYLIGIVFPLGYGLFHLLAGTKALGVVAILCGISALFSLINYLSNKETFKFLLVYSFLVSITLLLTSYHHGYRGLVFLFPFTAIIPYMMPLRWGMIWTLTVTVACLLVSLNVEPSNTVMRYISPLIISIGFSSLCAHLIYRQRHILEENAKQDHLTGITNRREFTHWLESESNKSIHRDISLFYIDIDNFKQINDRYGHTTGDKLLKLFSEKVLTVIRQNELIVATSEIYNFARLSGDEFILAIFDLDNIQAAEKIAERLLDVSSKKYAIDSTNIEVTMSIGVIYTDNFTNTEMLVHNADLAMYRAKKQGKNNFVLYDESLSKEANRERDVEKNISKALKNDHFDVLYMPIYKISDNNAIVGAEVLLRSDHPSVDLKGPEKFIPVAETSGQIKEIDEWVIEKTFADISKADQSSIPDDFWFAINISSIELLDSEFIEKIESLLEHYAINPHQIHLEITETKLVPYDDVVLDRLNHLKSLNLRLSMDDYGTGYTGFAQVTKFPGDYLKIDRSFVSEINKPDENYQKMIGVMLSIARIYDLKVIAEGIESHDQLQYLNKLGCDFGQGYFFSRPLDWDTLYTVISENPLLPE
jgi:diguanylate cyclase (GGDEF)-like protein